MNGSSVFIALLLGCLAYITDECRIAVVRDSYNFDALLPAVCNGFYRIRVAVVSSNSFVAMLLEIPWRMNLKIAAAEMHAVFH